jgi:hypothetical protein
MGQVKDLKDQRRRNSEALHPFWGKLGSFKNFDKTLSDAITRIHLKRKEDMKSRGLNSPD